MISSKIGEEKESIKSVKKIIKTIGSNKNNNTNYIIIKEKEGNI